MRRNIRKWSLGEGFTFPLRLEELADRTVPSVAMAFEDGVLTITGDAADDVVAINGLRLDPATHRVTGEDDSGPIKLDLGPTEFRLLHFLMTHPERVHSRSQLLDQVWGLEYYGEARTLDVHISGLRKKLGACGGCIETVIGIGYRFRHGAESAETTE